MRGNDTKRGIAARAVAGLAMTGAVASTTAVAAHAAVPESSGKGVPATGSQRLTGNGALFYGRQIGNDSPTLRAVDADGDRAVAAPHFPSQGMAWSPDGSKVAVAVGPDLTIYDASFSNPVPVPIPAVAPVPRDQISQPRWLPDGSGVAFLEAFGGIPELWTAKPDGTGASPVRGIPDSPTGYQAFDVLPGGGFVLNATANGSSTLSVWHPGDPALTPLVTGLFGPLAAAPDGTRVAVESVDAKTEAASLEVIDIASKTETPVAPLVTGTPVWSPDGTRVAYSAVGPAGANGLAIEDHVVVRDLASAADTTPVPPASGVFSVPLAWQPIPPGRAQEDRVGGADRVATAIDTSQLGFNAVGTGGRQAQSAVLSRSDTFADALAGSALAAHKKGPLLLTGTGSLDPAVATELKRVLPAQATVYLLGGTSALSDNVLKQVAALGFNPVRVAGADRDATAVEIAKQITTTPHTFLVATGQNFPDALAAGAAAGAQPDAVVLLSDDNTLSSGTKAYLTANHHTGDVLLGVGNQGSNALAATFPLSGITAQLRGHDRFDTAARLAEFYYSGPVQPPTVGVATGFNWPDALGGGAFLGAHQGPLLLTDGTALPPVEKAYLAGNSTAVHEIAVFGGASVVPKAAADSVADIAVGVGNWDYHLNRVAPPLP